MQRRQYEPHLRGQVNTVNEQRRRACLALFSEAEYWLNVARAPQTTVHESPRELGGVGFFPRQLQNNVGAWFPPGQRVSREALPPPYVSLSDTAVSVKPPTLDEMTASMLTGQRVSQKVLSPPYVSLPDTAVSTKTQTLDEMAASMLRHSALVRDKLPRDSKGHLLPPVPVSSRPPLMKGATVNGRGQQGKTPRKPKASPNSSAPQEQPNFPARLMMAMLQYEERVSGSKCLPIFGFLDEGGFVIWSQEGFCRHLLQEHGVSTYASFQSFVRRLTRYGFSRKRCEGGQKFRHKLFRKGQLELCQKMVSKHSETKLTPKEDRRELCLVPKGAHGLASPWKGI